MCVTTVYYYSSPGDLIFTTEVFYFYQGFKFKINLCFFLEESMTTVATTLLQCLNSSVTVISHVTPWSPDHFRSSLILYEWDIIKVGSYDKFETVSLIVPIKRIKC